MPVGRNPGIGQLPRIPLRFIYQAVEKLPPAVASDSEKSVYEPFDACAELDSVTDGPYIRSHEKDGNTGRKYWTLPI